MTARRRAAAVLGLTATLAGCVTPARTTEVYEAKAALSAEDALSSIRTALLAVRTHDAGDLPGLYLEPVLVDAETSVDAVLGTFDSVQPPDTDTAEQLRETLDGLLEDGSAGVTDLRIAARQGDRARLSATVATLTQVADDLEQFGRAQQS